MNRFDDLPTYVFHVMRYMGAQDITSVLEQWHVSMSAYGGESLPLFEVSPLPLFAVEV